MIMKKLFLLLFIATAVFVNVSCDKETDDNNNDNNTEVLPPDTGPITGTIDGVINEAEWDPSQSTTTVTISRLCHTIEKFVELQNQIAVKPQGAVVMVIVAMRIYQQYPIEGMKCLTATCTSPLTVSSSASGSYNGEIMANTSTLKSNLASYPRLPFIYYEGANPDNGYVPNGPPYVVKLYTNQYSYNDGRIKLFVETLGADSNRPATVKKVGNIYKVTEFSSLYLAHKPITQ
jgi:hypothetical protein